MTRKDPKMRRFRWFSIVLITLIVPAACGHQATVSHTPASHLPHQVAHLRYSIQAGAFSHLENAARFADTLERRGLDAYHFTDRDGLFKVRFGDFASKDLARQKAKKLVSGGIIEAYYIVPPGGYRRYGEQTLRLNILRTAEGYIGLPYRWGGASPEKGFDCSGLTMTVYRLNGLNLPRSSIQQFNTGTPVPRGRLRRGDLVFFCHLRRSESFPRWHLRGKRIVYPRAPQRWKDWI